MERGTLGVGSLSALEKRPAPRGRGVTTPPPLTSQSPGSRETPGPVVPKTAYPGSVECASDRDHGVQILQAVEPAAQREASDCPPHQLSKWKGKVVVPSPRSGVVAPWVNTGLIYFICAGHLSAAQGSGHRSLWPNFGPGRRTYHDRGHGVLLNMPSIEKRPGL